MATQIQGTTPLWVAARTLLHERGDELFRCWERVLKAFAPEDVHDLRVASRRLREGLALFAPCYGTDTVKQLDRRIRKVTRLLGEMRNTDEAVLFFNDLAGELHPEELGALEPFVSRLCKGRKREARRIESGLRKMDVAELKDYFQRAVNTLPLFAPPENGVDLFASLSDFARDSITSKVTAIRELLPLARNKDNIEAHHGLRIMVKHFRYRMEILSCLIGPPYQQCHAAMKGYQDVLGRMHDLDVFSDMVGTAGFAPECETTIMGAIKARRESFFEEFSAMLTRIPPDGIATQVRDRL